MATVKKPDQLDAQDRIWKGQMVETQEMHCANCGRFLGYQAVVWGLVKIKCPNCKVWNTVDVRPDHKL